MSPDRPRLGQLLLEGGFVDEATLDLLLSQKRATQKRLQRLVIEHGLITGAQLTQILSHQFSLPWVSPDDIDIPKAVLAEVPAEVALRYRLLPLYVRRSKRGDALYVATDDPTDEEALSACRQATAMPIRFMVAAPEQLDRAIAHHYGGSAPPPAAPPRAMGAVLHAASIRPPRRRPPPPIPGKRAVTDATELGWEEIETIEEPARVQPSLLLIHAPRALETTCAAIADRLDATLVTADLTSASDVAQRERPSMFIVPEDVYAFDRVAFNSLAMKLRAHLVVWSDDIDADYLEPLIAAARGRPGAPDAPPA